MFESLTDKLTTAIKRFGGKILTPENIKDTLGDIRLALLEADVALPVVKQVLENIAQQAIGQDVLKSLRPSETLVKIVNDELLHIMGDTAAELNLNVQPPAIILVAGLQGSGKTTTVAKLAKYLKERSKKKVLLTSVDIYRPSALDQLEVLANQAQINFYQADQSQKPVAIAEAAIKEARQKSMDVVIVDTAGRLHIDQEMMAEIIAIHKAISPIETLFVVDSMTGQDAANTAREFSNALPLTGVILTKVDGDARGGAALSVKLITGKPIKFVGIGEKLDAFEPFYPDRIVSRILGMGDILGLIEQTQQKVDQAEAQKLAKKFIAGKGFNFEDFRAQLQQLRKMGGLGNLLSKLPNMAGASSKVGNLMNDKVLINMEAIISSMTKRERHFPDFIKNSQKQRIAKGSGTSIQDVNRLLKQFTQMGKMMKKLKGKNIFNLMKNIPSFPQN